MKYRYLGNSGLAVSRVCLGTATFGQKEWGCNEDTANKILDVYLEQGGNFIDTANQYANTCSEKIIGNWLKNKERDNFVIASKCFFPMSNNINDRGLSRKHIVRACEGSLKRLNTDYIDLYQAHNQDPITPLEETLSALDHLVNQGKVRYLGLSNYPAWKIIKSVYLADQKNMHKFIAGQYLYNLLKRDIEREILPAANDVNIGIMCWAPLSGGMLTGKYVNPNYPIQDSRLSLRKDIVLCHYKAWFEKSLLLVNKLKEIADNNNVTPSVIALSWLLKNKQIASVIVGSNKPQQILESCKAGEWEISDQDWAILNELSKLELDYLTNIKNNTTENWFSDIL